MRKEQVSWLLKRLAFIPMGSMIWEIITEINSLYFSHTTFSCLKWLSSFFPNIWTIPSDWWECNNNLSFSENQAVTALCIHTQSCLTLCDPMGYIGYQALLWNFPGKNTGVSSHFLLQFNPGIKPASSVPPALEEPLGKPNSLVLSSNLSLQNYPFSPGSSLLRYTKISQAFQRTDPTYFRADSLTILQMKDLDSFLAPPH